VQDARLILDFLSRGRRYSYGPHRSQRVELHKPPGKGPHPVMILIHGGSWRERYGKIVMRGVGGDLLRRGWAVWNIEYRRLGGGGGWPETFEDVAAAVDLLAQVREQIDHERVSVLGHSAGGQLALWTACREHLPAKAPGANPRIHPVQAISQAGVVDLAGGYRAWHGGAVKALMGGSPEELPERYAIADPICLLPPRMPVLLVHGSQDATVTVRLSQEYAQRAKAAGADAQLIEIDGPEGSHRKHIDPRGAAWAAVVSWLARPVGSDRSLPDSR